MANSLRDIIDVTELQEMMSFFCEAVGVPVSILDRDQQWLVTVGWQPICTKFHHLFPASRESCLQSSLQIQKYLSADNYQEYRCPHGLQEVAFPILLDNTLLGVFFMGQFLYEKPDLDYFRRQAIAFGYDINAYLQALALVPVISKERVDDLMSFFIRFLGLLTRIGEENKRRQFAESETKEAKEQLEVKVEVRTRELNLALNEVGDLAVQLSSALSQVEQLAVTDSLTETFNRRKFDEIVVQEHAQALNGKQSFSVIMFDIDFFKRVNDTFGHSVGDRVLQHLCRVVRGLTRHADLLIRWGGEEFLILLPATFLDEAVQMAERTRLEVEQEEFPVAGHLTISLGVAQFRSGDSIDSLLKRVDTALYQAKKQGRNLVIVETQKV